MRKRAGRNLAMQSACRDVKVNMSEHEVGGILDSHLRKQSLNPLVTLIAADDRIERFRHPIPTEKKVARYVMLVTCAEYRGLISCMTRFVHFGQPSADLKKKIQAVANIDAGIILSTKPGRRLSEIFAILQKAYAENGFGDQWKFHHQGGPTGYANREAIATPDSPLSVLIVGSIFSPRATPRGRRCQRRYSRATLAASPTSANHGPEEA